VPRRQSINATSVRHRAFPGSTRLVTDQHR
jgi:hypothetical protein